MKKKIILAIAALVVIIGAVLSLSALRNGKNGIVKYRTEALAKGNIEALVVTTGTVNPVEIVDVGSQASGKIEGLYVDFNSDVKAGQVVAELDKSNAQSRVDQNQANYLSAQASLDRTKVTLDLMTKKFERAKSLFDKNLISYEEKESAEANYLGAKSDLQAAEARVEQAKGQLEASRVDLGYTVIRSPVDGIVISREINIGQTVAASFQAPVLFQIATDLTKMKVECSVDEADIGQVKEGQKARFTVEAFPDETFNGLVKQVRYSPLTVQNVVTYTTIIDVENPELKLRPGMTATVSIVTGEAKEVLRVPNSALRFTPNLSQVEMQEVMKRVQERFQARRQEAGQGPAASARPEAQAAPQGAPQSGAGQRMAGFGQGGFQLPPGAKQPSKVWVEDKSGKLNMVFLRLGVTDNSYTEVLRGDLKEGDLVLIGYQSGTAAASGSRQGGPPPMMFMGRR